MIPGITTRRRLPRLGKIRLGEKRKSQGGKEYPAALDHFNFADAPGLDDILGKIGPDTKALPVEFMTDNGDEAFFTSRSCYGKSSGLFCRCSDGETATRVYVGAPDPQGAAFVKEQGTDVREGEMFQLPCDGEECPFFANGRCKNLGSLRFKVRGQVAFGFYQINTSSFHSIVNICTVLEYVKGRAGRLMGVPFVLRLVPQGAVVNGSAKTIHVLQLVPPGDEALDNARFKAKALPPAMDARDDLPDDLVPFGGAALDADLGKAPRPETRMAPEPGASKIDQFAGTMKPGPAPTSAPAEEPLLNDPSELFDEPQPGDDTKATRRARTTRAAAKGQENAEAAAAAQKPAPIPSAPPAPAAEPWAGF